MTENFKILQEYVSNFSYDCPLAPELFINPYKGSSRLVTTLGINIKSLSGDELFLVSLQVDCNTKLSDDRTLFALNLKYDVLVAMTQELSDDDIREYLNVTIPQTVYPAIRDAVYIRTMDIGFSPVRLSNYSFKDKKVVDDPLPEDEDDNQSASSQSSSPHICFMSLIEDAARIKEGADFLEVLRKSGEKLDNLEDFNLFRCMYAFMNYTDFSVAPEVSIDTESKKMLFYLIAGSDDCEWRMEKADGKQLPELIVKFKDHNSFSAYPDEEVCISQMSESELFDLCTSLFVGQITKTSVNFLLIEIAMGLTISLENANFVNQDEYRTAFAYQSLDKAEQEFIDSAFEKIAKTRIETFLFQ